MSSSTDEYGWKVPMQVPNMAPAQHSMTAAQELQQKQLYPADPALPASAIQHTSQTTSSAPGRHTTRSFLVMAMTSAAAAQQVTLPTLAATDEHGGQRTPSSLTAHASPAACVEDSVVAGQQHNVMGRTGAPGRGATCEPTVMFIKQPSASLTGVKQEAPGATYDTPMCSRDDTAQQSPLWLCPASFLLDLLQRLDSAGLLALFSTCRDFQGMVLQHTHTTKVQALLLEDEAISHALAALQLASQHGSRISLSLKEDTDAAKHHRERYASFSEDDSADISAEDHSSDQDSDWDGDSGSVDWTGSEEGYSGEGEEDGAPEEHAQFLPNQWDREAWASLYKSQYYKPHKVWQPSSSRTYALLQMGLSTGALHRVTSLKLTGVDLDALLPPVVGLSCPNLTHLELRRSTVRLEPPTARSYTASFTNLLSLHLHEVRRNGCRRGWKESLHQQIGQLTALTGLVLRACDSDREGHGTSRVYGQFYGSIVNALVPTMASQLTKLVLNFDSGRITPELVWHMSGLPTYLTAMQRVKLYSFWQEDLVFSQFLALPCLSHVTIAHQLALSSSFAQQPCQWSSLAVYALGIKELAWLPLHANLLVEAEPGCNYNHLIVKPSELAMVDEALANMARSRWSGWKDNGVVYVDISALDLAVVEAQLVQVLPLLSGASCMFLSAARLGSSCMQSLSNFAATQRHGFHLGFGVICKWALEDILTLVSSMPAGNHVTVYEVDEHVFTHLCCAAPSGVTVHARSRKQCEKDVSERICATVSSSTGRKAEAPVLLLARDYFWRYSKVWELVVKVQ